MNYGTRTATISNKKGKMSTSPYSLDLREKVIKFVTSGNSQRAAARVFNISKTTVNTWFVRYKKEGNCHPKKRLGAQSKMDMSQFIKYVEDNPNSTTSEIGRRFGITRGGAHYWLRKLAFSYKKKTLPTWRQIKSSGKII